MIGTTGLSCIACHEFNGQRSGEVSALDLARVTERLQKNWFNLYMRQPSRFHPTVIMPSYWPDGQSIRPNILGGDTAQQTEALWTFLEDGIRAKKPMGLSRQSNELRVGDVTEICRGQSPLGYRGIGVGSVPPSSCLTPRRSLGSCWMICFPSTTNEPPFIFRKKV